MDFDWPIGKVWKGYINPHEYLDCSDCAGSGYGPDARQLSEDWYGFKNANYQPNPFRPGFRYNVNAWSNNLDQDDVDALVSAGRLWDFTRVPINDEQREIVREKIANGGNSWLPFNNGRVPSAKEVNEWNLKGMGHDSLNASICIRSKSERLGYILLCSTCSGEGFVFESQEIKDKHDGWEKFDPPHGEGFQLWETTSEGSPKSPVFDTLQKLCEWLDDNKISKFGKHTATREEWYKMLSDGIVAHQEGNIIFM